jgi:serine/threonine protein kinase
MGAVSRALDTQTGATIAIKQLTVPAGTSHSDRRVALFQREYHILTQLAYPNVVHVFDYGVYEDKPFYTMELLVGRRLRAGLEDVLQQRWAGLSRAARDLVCAMSLCASLTVLRADTVLALVAKHGSERSRKTLERDF